MEAWKKDTRREPVITDLDSLVPQDYLLRKIEKVMDYEWLYERLSPYYCHDNGRPGTDPMDAGYKTPWIAKKTLDDGKISILPYTRYKGKKGGYKPWDYE
jgi:hypothetical protein